MDEEEMVETKENRIPLARFTILYFFISIVFFGLLIFLSYFFLRIAGSDVGFFSGQNLTGMIVGIMVLIMVMYVFTVRRIYHGKE